MVETASWSATLYLNRQDSPELKISGEVTVRFGSSQSKLSELERQGIYAQNLYLLLEIPTSAGRHSIRTTQQTVEFTRPANQGQFTEVTIFCEDEAIISLPVKEIEK